MSSLQRLRVTRHRALGASETPRTPEPMAQDGAEEPSSPPRQRFRLKRRVASQATAEPTSQFLEHVASADVPIPSIEEPVVFGESMVDIDGLDMHSYATPDAGFPLAESRFSKAYSPPKTPAPSHAPAVTPGGHHDWSIGALSGIESSPEYDSSRPSTARSTQTSASLFSQFSFTPEDLSECASPEPQYDTFLRVEDAEKMVRAPERISVKRKAPWTRAMNQHLWGTYSAYLQDPTVTPIRISKNGMPPQGVLLRVVREARRTWKGPGPSSPLLEVKEGSSTPVANAAGATSTWPHSDSSTRAHLRELCRAKSGTATRNVQYLTQSPTPFGKTAARRWSRQNTPARSSSFFAGNDMAVSLALSTADSMQLRGPLAELTRSAPIAHDCHSPDLPPLLSAPLFTPSKPAASEVPRLGSPFVAKSYGPSSSNTLFAGVGAEDDRQVQTIGPQNNIKTPARANRPRSRSNTLRRRSRQTPAEMRRTKRPSLASDMWSEPGASPIRQPSEPVSRSLDSEQQATTRSGIHDVFHTSSSGGLFASRNLAGDDTSARAGLPFGGLPSSFSFPNRHSSGFLGLNEGALYRPFGSVQRQRTHQDDQDDSALPRMSLESRLSYLGSRLEGFRQRDQEWQPRRSESPF